ncbi:PQQ-binding-like beta-propeller repeat protein [Maribellus maritimus]|uniref:PQQ-binding-like beta-propeller repeat protein n=1 Tax=Maribellus maritimus TaxID=2870838 RepID=UPI001EEAEB73|nr:PQQ-binding-like beta-propeller repeat protein [Maribellus maritimus]MCG6189389.1 PQQ-like beta-propeller repeat protein [Maribellus maritimus]
MKKIKPAFLLIFILFFNQFLMAQNIYQWRGPARDGKYNEKGLLTKWPQDGPRLLWSAENLGAGYAAPVVSADKLLVMGVENGNSTLFAFDLSGKILWKSSNGKSFVGSGYAANFPGARSTPTVVGDRVYATSGTGRIACFDLNTGEEVWAVDMVNDLKGFMNEFSYSESLVTDDKYVYCFPGGKEISVAKLNRFTGETVWTSKATGDTTHFVSPILVDLPARRVFVSTSRNYIFGVDGNNGELLWKYKIAIRHDGDHANTPVYDAPYIYIATNDNNGKGTIKMELSSDGKSVKEVWSNKQVKNDMGGMIVADQKLFLTTENRNLNILDPATGNVIDKTRSPFGGLIFADNKFICYGTNGDVSLFNYNNGKLTPGGTFKITMGSKEHFSHPVVANGVLYIRHGEALMAYQIK